MHRYFVTGTDTDVGKTRATAALAAALRDAGHAPTIVKPVQTGVGVDDEGDAARAGRLASCRSLELIRMVKAADPWSAALAAGVAAPRVAALAAALRACAGALVVEGAGGLMVPLNRREHFGHLAVRAELRVLIAVGLRLGCLNHALLTAAACRRLGADVAGAVLIERWGPTDATYRSDVVRTLQGKMKILGILPFALDEPAAVTAGARVFDALVRA